MYVNPVSRGLLRGYRCTISGVEFIAHDPSKEESADLYRDAVDYCNAVCGGIDEEFPSAHKRTAQEYRRMYEASR